MISATKAKISPGKLLINGQWSDGSGKSFDTFNPATGEVLTQIAEAGASGVNQAVAAARKAFDDPAGAWRKMSASERGKILWRIGDLIEKNIEELAELETLNNGKPIFESRYVDMPMVADVFRYYAGWATKIHGETVNTFNNAFTYTLREPVGVVGAIVAWNFPLLLASWKLGPALACGNCVILKPAEQTPLTALRFGELALEAGLPPGVLNIVTGGPETGAALVKHPQVDKIAFTGSTCCGQRDHAQLSGYAEARDAGTGRQVAEHCLCRFADGFGRERRAERNLLRQRRGLLRRITAFRRKKVQDEFMTKLVE